MAQDKKSFVLYADYLELIEELSDGDAGQLMKHLFRYVNDLNPTADNPIVKISFIPIKMQLKRDLAKYEKKKQQWSEAGKASAEKRRKEKESNGTSTESTVVDSVATESTVNDNDNDNDNVNDNVLHKCNEREEAPPQEKNTIFEKFKNTLELDLDSCLKESIENQQWLETISMNNHLKSIEITKKYIDIFYKKLQNEGVVQKSLNDFKSHFARWLSLELKNKKNEKNWSIDTKEGQFDLLNAVAEGIARAEYK